MSTFEEALNKLKDTLLSPQKQKAVNEVYVTEIVSYYYPYPDSPAKEVLLRGHVYHAGLQCLLREFPVEIEVSKKVAVNGKEWLIKGRVDMVTSDAIVEIKSSKKSLPFASLQLNIYRYLMQSDKKLVVLYPDLTYDVVSPMSFQEVENKIMKYLQSRLF